MPACSSRLAGSTGVWCTSATASYPACTRSGGTPAGRGPAVSISRDSRWAIRAAPSGAVAGASTANSPWPRLPTQSDVRPLACRTCPAYARRGGIRRTGPAGERADVRLRGESRPGRVRGARARDRPRGRRTDGPTAVAADRDGGTPARRRAAAARARRVRRRRGRAPDAGRAREPARARGQGAASGASGERRADPGLPAVALAAPRRGLPPRVDFAFPRTTIWRPRHISPHEEDAMKYLCLIYQDEQGALKVPTAEMEKAMAEYWAFTDDIKKSGHHIASNGLQPTKTATTVRVRNGKVSTTDGPFAETKEQLGGFYLIEAKDLNDAIQVAARIPSARWGSVEVRPIWESQRP